MKKLLLILLFFPMIGFGQNVNIPDTNFKAYLLGNIAINTNGDAEIQVSEAIVFNGTIDCNNLNISDLTGIADFTILTELDCNNNNLTSLDLSQNTSLTLLYCANNQLTSLDINAATALNVVQCQNNDLTSLDVSNNTALTFLYSSGNSLTNLDVTNNIDLLLLTCSYNDLTSLDVSNNLALTYLSCSYNQLTTLEVSTNTALNTLYCHYNQLTSLDVSANTALTILHCYLNQLTILDISNDTALIELSCYFNQLTSLDVSNNTALIELYCENNQLTSLNVKNGNNLSLLYLYATNNPNLTCITVDNVAWSTANWSNVDSWSSFSEGYFSTNSEIACDSYTWNGITHTTSGVYTYNTTTSAGCDSIATLNLTINEKPVATISQIGIDLEVSMSATYFWNTSATTQTITPTANGLYWCEVTDINGCIGDTAFYEVINIVSAIKEVKNTDRKILRITNMLGQETPYRKNIVLIYIYDDGNTEKKMSID